MTLEEFRAVFAEAGLSELYDEMQQYAKNSIVIEVQHEVNQQVLGASRFGGEPDLPPEIEWFSNSETGSPLNFIAQFNCAELSVFDKDNKLPKQGMLYFFYDVEAFLWGFDARDSNGSRVYFYDGVMERLEPRLCPAGIRRFPVSGLLFANRVELPEYTSQLIQTKLSDEEYGRYLDLIEELDLEIDNKLLGHSNNIQKGMELQCELVHHGIYCGSSAAVQNHQVPEFTAGATAWELLFQMGSDDDNDVHWAEDGRLYFWIRSEDLIARRFERAWQILQSY